MKVSVVLLTYNHEPYIIQALDSVLAQSTSFLFEVLISEDCSTDNTRDIVIGYARQHPERIRLFLSAENINTNFVLSRAIAAAQGDYVATIDGDDFWISEEKLQRQAEFLDQRPDYALCFHNIWMMDGQGRIAPRPGWPTRFPETTDLERIVAGNFVATCSAMVRRSALGVLPGWYDDAEYGDWPLWILAAVNGKIGYIDQQLAVYRQHTGGNWTRQDARGQLEGILRFLDALELNLGPNFSAIIQRSRAGFREQLVQELNRSGTNTGESES